MERAPFLLNSRKPLILDIIDDVTFVAAGWPDDALNAWQKITGHVLAVNRLSINEKKSCSPGTIEKSAITFIGCHWNFNSMEISASADKLASIIKQYSILIGAASAAACEWQRIIGRCDGINDAVHSTASYYLTRCGSHLVGIRVQPPHVPPPLCRYTTYTRCGC